MLKYILTIIFIFFSQNTSASDKENIIKNLNEIQNISFKFEQNINGKVEKGNCVIEYPKKIYCKYNSANKKILVSNGKTLVIKTKNSYYIYSLEKTSLNLILDQSFLVKKILEIKEKKNKNRFLNYNFFENGNEIDIFFDKRTFNLIGWQTIDIFQNISITYLSEIKRNQKLERNLFILPKQN